MDTPTKEIHEAKNVYDTSITVQPLDNAAETSSLGHMPREKWSPKRFLTSLKSKDAWFGDYDYGALLIPNLPGCKRRELPFYDIHDKLPYLLIFILGLQHALAMVGGLVVPPLLLAGAAGSNQSTEVQSYLISASLIWCSVGTVIQITRIRFGKSKYYIGTGLISVTGTSFAFANVALKYLQQSYQNGTCPVAPDGTKLPCPDEFGAILGTSCVTGVLAIALSFMPPRIIKKAFPPLVTGGMLMYIGATLVSSGITNWAGGAGLCSTDHTVKCVAGSQQEFWGSAKFIGLGFSCFITIILCEIFGSAFMKSAAVFLGLLVGMVIGAACGYFDGKTIKQAPGGTFLFVHTFKLSLRGQLVLPMLAAWCIIVAESIGNITASADASRLDITTEHFMSRVQGGMLADGISATLAGLMTTPPLTTFAQNSAVIALTRNASLSSGYMCAFFLLIMGIIGKFGAIFAAAPPAVIGGFTTFLFGSVITSGVRVLSYCKWTRRDRFIATASLGLGMASLTVPDWFSYIFTYKGDNKGISGLIQAVELIVEEPYLVSAILGSFLNAVIPDEMPTADITTTADASTTESHSTDGDKDIQQPGSHNQSAEEVHIH